MNGKNRSYLMGVVGGYLIYLAYQLFQSMGDPEAGMSPAARIIFIALFALSGIGLVIYAFRLWAAANREEKEGKEEKQREDENNLK